MPVWGLRAGCRRPKINFEREAVEIFRGKRLSHDVPFTATLTRAIEAFFIGRDLSKTHLNLVPFQAVLDLARQQTHSRAARRDRRRRQQLMEASFADAANNHHFKRARWRRLWRQQIQDYLIAAIQNVRILLAYSNGKRSAAAKIVMLNFEKTEVRPTRKHLLPQGGLTHRSAAIMAASFSFLGLRLRSRPDFAFA